MTETEYEELKPNRLLLESKVNVVLRKGYMEVIKNSYRFINGKYTNNDFIVMFRKIINLMKKENK
jgi:hypothetical protein